MTDYHLFAEDVVTTAFYDRPEDIGSPTDRVRLADHYARRKSARITLVRIAGEVIVS